MGYDAQCDVRLDGQTASAKAVLEQKDLVLRGPLRLSIPLARISEATASDGWLRVRFDGRLAEISLGPAAQKWAQRITNPPSRLAKLGVKEGVRILLVGAVEEAFVEELRAAGATALRRMGRGTPAFDVIFLAVERRESLEQLERARVEDRALGSNLDVACKRATGRHRGGYDGGRQAGGPRRRQSRQLLRYADGRKVRDPGRETTQGECRRQAIDRTRRCAAKTPPARAVTADARKP